MIKPEGQSTNAPPAASSLLKWAPWGLALVILALGFSVWESFPPGIWHDDGVYVLLGRSLAEGDGLRYVGVQGAPLAPKFPPLFPLVLSLIWILNPSIPENIPLLGAVNIIVTAVASGIFALYLKKVLQLPAPFALAVTAIIWISAHLWRVASVPLSEPIFLLCLLLALWAGGKMEEKEGSGPALLFLLAGGCALYARTLGVAVLVAGAAALLFNRRRKAAFWIGSGTLALLLPWVLWTRWAVGSIPDPLLDTLGPYGGWLVGQILHQPSEFALFVVGNAGHLLARIVTLLIPGLPVSQGLLGAVMAPVLILGLWELFRRSKVLVLTLGLSLGILLVWPFQEIRLLVPFQPILMLSVVMGFWRFLYSPRWNKTVRAVGAVAALAWAGAFTSVNLFRLSTGWVVEPYGVRSEALLDASRAVREKTPPDAVVGAPELWSGIHLITGRTVIPSARFRPLSGDEPVEGTPQQQYEVWIESGVTHILVEHGGRVHGSALDRIDALCAPGTISVLDMQPGRVLVALAWDTACQDRVLQPESPSG